jgi:hypothetical protein
MRHYLRRKRTLKQARLDTLSYLRYLETQFLEPTR